MDDTFSVSCDPTVASFPGSQALASFPGSHALASFPGSHAREREHWSCAGVEAINIRVPGEPGNEATNIEVVGYIASFPGLQSPNAVEGLVKLVRRMTSNVYPTCT